jgi:hypothetical protein
MILSTGQLDTLQCRQAVEALRNGVPNGAAVETLGCNRPEIESRFDDLLLQAIDKDIPPESTLGMLVSGDFGSGKSHLLSFLEHRALAEGFVCSRVAISKETPLYNLGQVFISAIRHARLPGRAGQLMEEIGDRINAQTQDYDQFSRWLNVEENGLHPYFPATMMIYERSNDFEMRSEIESFWGGERIAAAKVKEGLRVISQQQSFPNLRAPKAGDLPPQRLRFATELIKGAGYKGWVVLIDELELVGSYSLLQRARSYAELARWLGKTTDEQYPGLIAVGTVTRGFEADVLGSLGKNDRDVASNRLRERNDASLATRADAAIRALEREPFLLQSPSAEELQGTLEKLRQLYQQAYGWDTPVLAATSDSASYRNTMRYKIRACINEWDLLRLYPDVRPETEGQEFEYRYEEMPEMEEEVKDDAEMAGN